MVRNGQFSLTCRQIMDAYYQMYRSDNCPGERGVRRCTETADCIRFSPAVSRGNRLDEPGPHPAQGVQKTSLDRKRSITGRSRTAQRTKLAQNPPAAMAEAAAGALSRRRPQCCCQDRTSVGVAGQSGCCYLFWVSGPESYAAGHGLFADRPFSRMNSEKA